MYEKIYTWDEDRQWVTSGKASRINFKQRSHTQFICTYNCMNSGLWKQVHTVLYKGRGWYRSCFVFAGKHSIRWFALKTTSYMHLLSLKLHLFAYLVFVTTCANAHSFATCLNLICHWKEAPLNVKFKQAFVNDYTHSTLYIKPAGFFWSKYTWPKLQKLGENIHSGILGHGQWAQK